MRELRSVAVGVAVACWLIVGAGPAEAGQYPVLVCGAAKKQGFRSDAFILGRSNADMVVGRDCTTGPGQGGVITRNRVSPGRARYRSTAYASFDAPPGTVIRRLVWSGQLQRLDCDWKVDLVAAGRGYERVFPLPRRRQPRRCGQSAEAAEISGYPAPREVRGAAGATRILQRVVCTARRGCATSATRRGARADARTWHAQIDLLDVQGQKVSVAKYGLFSGQWVRGLQPVRLSSTDNVGIAWDQVSAGPVQLAFNKRICSNAQRIPCPNGSAQLRVDTARAGEGTRALKVQVADGGSNVTTVAAVAKIDNVPPTRVRPTVEGGEAWRRRPGFSVAWVNAPEGDRAPIAGVVYRLRSAGTQAWGPKLTRSAGGISRLTGLGVPPGDWELVLWRSDAAGNHSEALASDPVHLRYDPEPPQLSFERQRPSDPAGVAVGVMDHVSGLAGGEIELRRQGEAIWRTLMTRREGSRLVARVDDGALPAGIYALRARAVDHAGNQGFADRLADGFPAVIRLPARAPSTLNAGIVGRRVVHRRVRRHGKRRTVRVRVNHLLPQARVRHLRYPVIAGRLVGPGGRPRAGATLRILSRVRGGPEGELARIRTDAHGRFRHRMVATHSQLVRVVFGGTAATLPAQREMALSVPASGGLRASRRRLPNGRSVVFSGRVRTLPLPAQGSWSSCRHTSADAGGPSRPCAPTRSGAGASDIASVRLRVAFATASALGYRRRPAIRMRLDTHGGSRSQFSAADGPQRER